MNDLQPSAPRRMPRRWPYVAAALLLVVGVLSLVLMFRDLSGYSASAARIPAPGRSVVVLPDSGKYLIAYEDRSVLDGKAVTSPATMPSMNVAVFSVASHSAVPAHAYGGDYTYSTSDAAGRAVAYFTINQAGKYLVVARYTGKTTAQQSVLAIGSDPMEFFGFYLSVGLTGILLGFVVGLTTLIRRHNAKKRLAQPVPPVPTAGVPAAPTGSG